MFAKLIDTFEAWKADRQRRRTEVLTAKAADLDEEKEYDLLLLDRRGFVRAHATGQSITRIYGDIENLVAKRLRVAIKPGTYFVARGNCQNMVTREAYSLTLEPTSTERVAINAACINANLPIPGEKDRFYGVKRVSDELALFLSTGRGEEPMVIQAGVWALTDNYSRYDVINHLITRDSRGNTSHPVTHDHCDRAMEILDSLGIKHRLQLSEIPYERKTVQYDDSIYVGEFRYGLKHGQGATKWNDGNTYEGAYVKGKRHGKGTFVWKNGGRYVGSFFKGNETGGWYHYPDGTKSWARRNANDKLETSLAVSHSWEDFPCMGQTPSFPSNLAQLTEFVSKECAWDDPKFTVLNERCVCVIKVLNSCPDEDTLTEVTEAVVNGEIEMNGRYAKYPTFPIVSLMLALPDIADEAVLEDYPDLSAAESRAAIDRLLECGLGSLFIFNGTPLKLLAAGIYRIDADGLKSMLDQASCHYWSIAKDSIDYQAAVKQYVQDTQQ